MSLRSSQAMLLLLFVAYSVAHDVCPDGDDSCASGSDATGADLNLLQVGLSMQSEKIEKTQATSILDLAPAKRLSLLAQADEMLKKDLTQHRARVQQWKANRTLLTSRKRAENTVSDAAAELMDKKLAQNSAANGYYAIQSSIASGIAVTLKTIIQGGDAATVAQMAATQASNIAGASLDQLATLGLVHPLLAIGMTMITTMLSGLVPGSNAQAQAMENLYKTIIKQVTTMISEAVLSAKLDTVKDKVTSISEELQWVPDMLAQLDSSEVKMSYLLTVQHDLATNARGVFGDCFDNLNSNDCKSWEEAGTIEVALKFAELHLSVFTELYSEGGTATEDTRRRRRRKSSSSSSSVDGFQTLLAQKAYSVAKKYKCLLDHSWTTFTEHRENDDLEWRTKESSSCSQRQCNRNRRRRKSNVCDAKCCSHNFKIRDNVAGTITEIKSDGSYAPPCLGSAKQAETENAAKQKIRSTSESMYLTVIHGLTKDVLTTADFNNPCR